jgi:predicted component of type VI protein secretion system
MSTETEYEKLVRVTGEARDVLRELRGTLKDIKDVRREVDGMIAEIHDIVKRELEVEVAAGLAGYAQSLLDAVDKATKKVYARFDTLTAILTDEDPKSKRKKIPSLQEALEARAVLEAFGEKRAP